MAGRGRRAGYNNYTVQDQLLLCNVVEQMLPVGRNMWEQVAARFNANHGGENDAAFEAEVDEATAQRTLRGRGAGPAPATGAAIDTGIQPGALDDADSDADTVESGDEFDAADVVAAEGGGEDFPATTQARGGDEISQYAQRTTRDVAPTPDTQSVGSILTRSGVIDVNLAADFNLSTEEASEDDGCASNTTPALLQTPTPSAETPASRIDDNSSHSYIRVDSIEACDTNPRQSSQRSVRQDGVTTTPIGRGARAGGRPRTLRREAIPTTATPDGPMLHRDANREELDTRETDENQNLNVASNRLGGQDLRVFRDNIAVMTQNMLNANGEASSC
ncbi:hypothetical protein PF005_g10440 [Phytophthora fragariae]|uniref:DUF6818 domain-containing protein n=1 Tax=Phytophthora fragariae TaxID=53985 RepID=A0A6A3R6A3_9STRA|nr:hypothetical protein PF007_g25740 [Phytophthora fragariae]KAE9087487.1 hypothetical protein PF006_g25796 [Phytophthora fragariae]KAE9212797.1 hypothetical protein PF005_g10440 [Phytophthora fragariae]